MGCTDPLRSLRWGCLKYHHPWPLEVGSKLPLLLYADVRLHIPMTHHIHLKGTDQSIAQGPSGRTDWSVLPIIAVLQHTMHTGDVDYAAQRFDRLLAAHSYMQYISNVSGLVENDPGCLVDW